MFRPNRSETINDINERDSVFTIYNTLKGSPAAVHINTGDKKANIDGYIEFLDVEKRPCGMVLVQVKTYNARSSRSKPKYAIPSYLIGYALGHPCELIVLLVADNEQKRVFWKHISKEFYESISSKEGQKTVTYTFTDDEILTRDNACETVARWKRIYDDKAESMFDMYQEAELVMQSSVLSLLDVTDGIFGVPDSYIPRKECSQILDWLKKDIGEEDSHVLVLSGDAGTGKSVVLKKVLQSLKGEEMPCFAIKADHLVTGKDRNGNKYNVERIVKILDCIISRYGKAVMIIDQIDALSQYLSNDRATLNAMMDIISLGPRYGGKLKTVVSCRKYDMRFDASLRSLNKYDNIEMSRLEVSDVSDALDGLNCLSIDKMTESTIQLLTVPQNLDIFSRIAKDISDADTVIKVTDLYDRFYMIILQRAAICHLVPQEIEQLMFDIALKMREDETLHPIWYVDGSNMINIEFLCSEGVIDYDGKTVRFFHQSFYDYVIARYLVLQGMSVSEVLQNRHQGLFIRSTVKLWLEYLRNHDVRKYNFEIRELLTSSRIRWHLKTLALSMLLSVEQLSPYELRLIVSLESTCPPLFKYVLNNAKGEATFEVLYDCIRKFIGPIKTDSYQFPSVWTWIRDNINISPIAVFRLIDSVDDNICHERFLRIALLKLKDFSSPFVQEICDRYLQEHDNEYMFLVDAMDSSPEYVLNYAVRMIDQSLAQGDKVDLVSDVCEHLLFPLCEKYPEISYGPVKTLFMNLLTKDCFSFGDNFKYSAIGAALKDDTTDELEENIISILARCKSPEFVGNEVRSFMQTWTLIGMTVAMRVLAESDVDLIDVVWEVLNDSKLTDALLDTYQTEYYFLMSLKRCYATYNEQQKSYFIAYASTYQTESDFKTEGKSRAAYTLVYPQMYKNRFKLLSIIPESERTHEVKKLYLEYVRRFNKDVQYEKPVKCKCYTYATTAIASKKVCMSFTERQWVNSFLYAKDDTPYRKGKINTFSVYSHAEMFRECVKTEPEKHFTLVSSVFRMNGMDIRYRLAGLLGLLEGEMSMDRLSPLIKMAMSPEYLDFDYHRVFQILRLCAGADNGLFVKIENLLLGRVLSPYCYNAPSEKDAFKRLNDAINSEQGRALRTYISYCANEEVRQRVYSTLYAIVPLICLDMRLTMLYSLWDANYYDAELYNPLIGLCVEDFAPEYVIVLGNAFNSLWCTDHSIVYPYYAKALECLECHKVLSQIMFWGTRYESVEDESKKMLEKLIEKNEEDVISTLVRLSFSNLDDPDYGSQAECMIKRFARDRRAEVVNTYLAGTRELSPEHITLWKEISEGMVFPDSYKLTSLLDYLTSASQKYPYEAYECLRPHVSSLSDDISFLRKDYIALLLTIYSRLKEDNDLVAMDEIMDTIDELTLTDVGSYEDLIFNLKEENS